MKISEFAKKSGVTVKTLIHYEKIGLLNPSDKTEAGYRIYTEKDFLTLQQIITLKFIGLSLNEIKNILYNNEENIEEMIKFQKEALEEKRRHLDTVIEVFLKAEDKIRNTGLLEVENLIDIIKITNIENKVKKQYENSENFKNRLSLHSYNINKTPWNSWCFANIVFKNNMKVLEIGCGTGKFWSENQGNLNKDIEIVLSDYSKGMLDTTRENLINLNRNFIYNNFNAEHIPYDDDSFDIIIAQHMLYLIPNIDKALSEIKRVLKKDGTFYVTTNSCEAMKELNSLVEKFDASMGLHSNGMCERFNLENGKDILKNHFKDTDVKVLKGKIITSDVEAVVSYKSSSIKGTEILKGNKKKEFTEYIRSYVDKNGTLEITTKAGMFICKK
ncbi:MerR family transcriptional regulator [Clostridium ihumii]|uniref:MerR family transcriptional regulator n=1 Tax=Clostridium ihumii TaxID=1470356 RepID=UPI00058C3D21|nr:methyltransferase domain-containing protein [Clostridium ihumii]